MKAQHIFNFIIAAALVWMLFKGNSQSTVNNYYGDSTSFSFPAQVNPAPVINISPPAGQVSTIIREGDTATIRAFLEDYLSRKQYTGTQRDTNVQIDWEAWVEKNGVTSHSLSYKILRPHPSPKAKAWAGVYAGTFGAEFQYGITLTYADPQGMLGQLGVNPITKSGYASISRPIFKYK